MPSHQFQLVGGDAALDFVNTIHDWTAAEPRDYIPTFPDALRFAEVAGVVTATEARRLTALPSGGELRRLRDLRARLERILRALLAARSPSPEDLDELQRDAVEATRLARWRGGKARLERRIDPDDAGPGTVRLRLTEAALGLLTSERMERVRSCPSCGWFFVDTTKNRSRRWCSMAMCGSAAKARAYYWRTKRGTR